jgi:hypothetical protein
MLKAATFDSVCPGLCCDSQCLAVADDCEPDAMANYCYDCERNTVRSVLVIAGLI